MPSSVLWFRRDLRLVDNPALIAAAADGAVLPLFVLDPALWGPAGAARRAYLAASLAALSGAVGGLAVREGDPVRRVVHGGHGRVELEAGQAEHVGRAFGDEGLDEQGGAGGHHRSFTSVR